MIREKKVYELKVEDSFSAAHQLRNYKGKCERLHGHNWRVEVYVRAQRLNEIGIAIDFQELKRETKNITNQLDHTFINDVFPFTEINPSSENIAKWIFECLGKKLEGRDIKLSKITVWESEMAAASYVEED